MNDNDFQQFHRERDEALLSLDREKIEAYCRKYGSPFAADEDVFWASIHKARTALRSLPADERQKSIAWLRERGFSHMGDQP